MSWIKDIISPKARKWEEFYRNRHQHDKVVRSTHGVNCTGGCSWNVHVKDGIVIYETQAVDYPQLESSLPPYEPRGCQRGISFSWYLYSPLRIKYPLIRGTLIDLIREEKKKGFSTFEAWQNIQSDPEKRKKYQQSRGKGGFRRISWEEVLEIIGAANIATVKKFGPDRIAGFSPIPAMSMISYAGGSRFLQLMGGLNLSFYDWYCDLPNAFPEIWGEQTDVAESADWYNAKFVAVMGANLGMTRTPDVHFFAESRHNGTKTVVFSPDFNMVAKYADQWIPIHAGQDGAFWMAVTHVILKEYHHQKQVNYFMEYIKKYTDCPFLVVLDEKNGIFQAGRLLRANRIIKYKDIENGNWKFLNFDETTMELVCPGGSVGYRWGTQEGKWNLKPQDAETGISYSPLLTLINHRDEIKLVEFTEFALNNKVLRGVPVKSIETTSGKVIVTTVYDLLMAQYGIDRGLGGDYPADYTDSQAAYTPAWQEIYTGVSADAVINFAHEWTRTAEITQGKCMIIIGAGINHWYHNNLLYRSGIMALILTGCIGKNGSGINHYVGQEKLAPMDSWSTIMSGRDWQPVARLQQTPIWHYMNSDQWRYDSKQNDYHVAPENDFTNLHCADMIVKAVRNGWMPFYPQFSQSTLKLGEEAKSKGLNSDEEIKTFILNKLKNKELEYAVADIDNEINFPRIWYIWRGNAIMSSAKGHEYFLKHYLGTHHNSIADEVAEKYVKEVKWYQNAPQGKMDLIIDLNFRMDTSALYSDIVLPTASWYEKADINSTDMHSFIHPLAQAVPPAWESKSDWAIFREIAKATSEVAKSYFAETVTDIVTTPLAHDTNAEISQEFLKDWFKDECEAVPGKTMHNLVVVKRNYTEIYQKFISLGPNIAKNPLGAHGNFYMADDFYEKLKMDKDHVQLFNHEYYPSLEQEEEVINAILILSSLTNGALSVRAYKNAEKKTGLKLTDIVQGSEDVLLTYKDLQAAPKRYNNSPLWSGLMNNGRAYAAFTYNVERLVPWRTLTGRQHCYLDHEGYILFGEHLPTYKPLPAPEVYGELRKTLVNGDSKVLNYLTPHGKWHIHSTYGDNHRMLTLSRGMVPVWISEEDAKDLNIKDNDWVEIHNDNGVYSARACVSSRIPKGLCFVYHSPERTYSTPKSEIRKNKRAGGHNSLTRVHLKPTLMIGGYGQFTYHFNYWGPVGVNRDTYVVIRKMNKIEF